MISLEGATVSTVRSLGLLRQPIRPRLEQLCPAELVRQRLDADVHVLRVFAAFGSSSRSS